MSRVLYYGEELDLTAFHGRPCLWIQYPHQRALPKMEFVGGYPNEWCVFLDRLTDEEKLQIRPVKTQPEKERGV